MRSLVVALLLAACGGGRPVVQPPEAREPTVTYFTLDRAALVRRHLEVVRLDLEDLMRDQGLRGSVTAPQELIGFLEVHVADELGDEMRATLLDSTVTTLREIPCGARVATYCLQLLDEPASGMYGVALDRATEVVRDRLRHLGVTDAVAQKASDLVAVTSSDPRVHQVAIPGHWLELVLLDAETVYGLELVKAAAGVAGITRREDTWVDPKSGLLRRDDHLAAQDAATLERWLATAPVPRVPGLTAMVGPCHATPPCWRTFVARRRPTLDASAVTHMDVARDDALESPLMAVEFGPDGGAQLLQMTTEQVGRKIGVVVDGRVRSSPVVMEPISGSRAMLVADQLGDGRPEELLQALWVGSIGAPLREVPKRP